MVGSQSLGRRLLRGLSTAIGALAAVVLALMLAGVVSPWPSALAIRWLFERDGAATNQALQSSVPAGIHTQAALQYDPGDPDALLDIHRPAASKDRQLPVIVWIHGGGFVAGSREEVANYARILAGDGYAVVAVDYSLAPEAHYPRPVLQLNRALAFLVTNARRLGLDPDHFVLGGDSAGAQLAGQLAALVSSPDYSQEMGVPPAITRAQLRGAVLFCGPHDARLMARKSSSSWFLRTVMWSYFGAQKPPLATMEEFSVVPHVTARFPPTFVSVGNGDPLAPQSLALAEALERNGVRTETLFYPADLAPPLPHEYQFDLSHPESVEALRRTRAFLRTL